MRNKIIWLGIFLVFIGLAQSEEILLAEVDFKTSDTEISEIYKKSTVCESKQISSAICQFCKQKKGKYWKFFSKKIPDLIEENKFGPEFLLIPLIIFLYGSIIFLIYRKKRDRETRFIVQIFSFILLGIIFVQCLCNTKSVTIGFKNLFEGKFLLSLGYFWFALITIFVTFYLRNKFKKVYCYWVCPLGFAQDLIGKTELNRKLSNVIKLSILVILGFCIMLIMYFERLNLFALYSGILLVFFLVIISFFSLLYPQKEKIFHKFKYIALIFWVMVNIKNEVSGPWCTIAVGNITYPIIMMFIYVLIVSLIIDRAWCKYVCPDGGLFELLSGKKERNGQGVTYE